MKTAAIAIVAVLVIGGCGSDGGSGAPSTGQGPAATTDAVPATEVEQDLSAQDRRSAEAIARAEEAASSVVALFGDETAALRAVLLASDHGYRAYQILAGASSGLLQPDGWIVDSAGLPTPPVGEPSDLLVDDMAGNAEPTGFRTPRNAFPVSALINTAQDTGTTNGMGGLSFMFLSLDTGYTLGQIVTHLLADGSIGFREVGPDDDFMLFFFDGDGTRVMPGLPYWQLDAPSGGADPVAAPPSTEASATTTTEPSDERSLAELVDLAAGVYPVAQDLATAIAELSPGTDVVLSGEMVIDAEGDMSGEASWTETRSFEEGQLVVTNTVNVVWAPTELTVLDDGLTFETEVVLDWVFDREDQTIAPAPAHEEGTERFVSTGLVDPDIGQIVASVIPIAGSIDSIRFELAS